MQYPSYKSQTTVFSTLAFIFITLSSQIGFSKGKIAPTFNNTNYLAVENDNAQMALLNDGLASLQARINLIRLAKKSIELEYFIFDPDMSGKVIFSELIKRAKKVPGLKIRILIDKGLFSFKFNPYYIKALKEVTAKYKLDIKVRYYNPKMIIGLVNPINVAEVQYRDHRKLFIVDGESFITGGRNIGNNYFDGEADYNFWDRDIYVKGKLALNAQASFDDYWDNKLTKKPKLPVRAKPNNTTDKALKRARENWARIYDEKMKSAREFFTDTKLLAEAQKRMESITQPILSSTKLYDCPKATFVSDKPGVEIKARTSENFKSDFRITRSVIGEMITGAKERVILSSPYFIQFKEYKNVLDNLLNREKPVDVTIYTNSLASTDHYSVSYQFYKRVPDLLDRKVKIHVHSGTWSDTDGHEIAEFVKQATWGTHSKSHVYDYDGIMVGTFNLDNRSNKLNAENFVLCQGNEELAKALEESIMGRAHEGLQIISKSEAIDKNGKIYQKYGEPVSTMKFVKFHVLGWLTSLPIIRLLL